MSVKVDAKQEAPRIFSVEDANKMKLETELSDRQVFAFLRYIRATFGKPSIQKGIKSALYDRNNIFCLQTETTTIQVGTSGKVFN